ncbi:MAG TPA: beta-propeller fold lactonase family protein [Gammaproteobacteria bacterium]|nr:beta-propeller fold lactonase family protein [Gammaproteobacteria bacterium]
MLLTVARAAAIASTCVFWMSACGGGGGGGGGGNPNPPPATGPFAIGGTVTGLDATASGLVLQNNAGNDLAIAANGSFTFSTAIATGGAYAVTVKTQPNLGPLQNCSVTNGAGTVASAAVTNVIVACVTRTAKFLFVTNPGSNTVSGYSINAVTGQLTAVPGSPFATGARPEYVTAEPSGKFVYVTTFGSAAEPARIFGFNLNAGTGALTQLANSPFELSETSPPPPSQFGVVTVPALNPAGTLGYVAAVAPPTPTAVVSQLYGATISSVTGDLAGIAGTPLAVGYNATTPVVDSTGSYLFVPRNTSSAGTGGEIASYVISSPSGQLTPNGAAVPTGGNTPIVAAVPGGKFLLVPNLASPVLAVMAVDTAGALSAAAGSPFVTGAAGTAPGIPIYNRRLNVVYVVSDIPGPTPTAPVMHALAFNTTTGAVTPVAGSPYSTSGATLFPMQHPSGKFLYQVNKANQRLQRYTIDPASGALTLQPDFTPVSAGDHILVVDPSGRYAYVTSGGSATVSSYSIDATTGALTLVNTLPAGSGAFIPQTVGLQ